MRRVHPTLTAAVALVVAIAAMAPGVAAQDEPLSALEHPVLGSWTVDEDVDDILVFGPGGSVINANRDGVAVGAWTTTGERTADLSIRFRGEGSLAGDYTIRGSLEVSEDGATFTGTYTFEPSAELAGATGMEAGELGPGEVTGHRIVAEPMGEAIGPLPDFGQALPEDQGASPAPGASPVVEEMPAVEGSPAPEASPAG